MGADGCSALMADAADEPGTVVAMPEDRAVVNPAMGSVLVAGHNPLGALALRAAHAASLTLGGAAPFCCVDAAEMVDVVEACDDRLEEEPVRWTLFRGMNMEPPPLVAPSALHACLLSVFWYCTGGATAVIGDVWRCSACRAVGRAQGHFSRETSVFLGAGGAVTGDSRDAGGSDGDSDSTQRLCFTSCVGGWMRAAGQKAQGRV